jgi:2-methylisocitrate lyase-like PEP mutase family enzyme
MLAYAGFPVIASTSAGVGYTLGYPDGQRISREEMLWVVASIARAAKRGNCILIPGLGDDRHHLTFYRGTGVSRRHSGGPGFSLDLWNWRSLGVARVSLGSAPMPATLGLTREMAQKLRAEGTYVALEEAPSLAEVNRMMADHAS